MIYEGDIFRPGETIQSRAIMPRPVRAPMFNVSCRKVGGIWFLKLGRLCLSFCVTKEFRP